MLTSELLKSNDTLKDLTEDQIKAIESLSQRDEKETIDKNRSEWWRLLDRDIEEITGVKKEGGVKTYRVLRSVLEDMKEKAEKAGQITEIEEKKNELESEVQRLQSQIKNGAGDKALKDQVKQLEQQLQDKQTEISSLRESKQKEASELEKQLESQKSRVLELSATGSISDYITSQGLKLNSTIPDSIREDYFQTAKTRLLSQYKVDHNDNGLVFRDPDTKEILINKETGKPFTAGELFHKENTDLFETGRKQAGGGTKPPAPGKSGTPGLDLSGVSSQMKANDMIRAHVLKVEGIAKTDPRFAERQMEIYKENKVNQLPMREQVEE